MEKFFSLQIQIYLSVYETIFFSTENILVITQDSLLFMNKIFLNAEKICLTQIEFKNHDRIVGKTQW